ncbi:MAG: LPS O-antigen length regulator [Alteromonadaceae bacterium]|nr:LPS O-antigen length regulator [Alteromonadaceae bacterium]
MVLQSNQTVEDYSLLTLFRYLWRHKIQVFSIPLVSTLIAVIWSLSISNTYLSDAILSPTEEAQGGGLQNIAGQLGGLASLAGISVGDESSDNVTVAIAIMQSRKFSKMFTEKYKLAVPLLAVTDWDQETGELTVDEDIYDVESNVWVRTPKHGRPVEPTALELYELYRELISIERDSSTGLVHVSLEYYSPVLAQKWLEAMIMEINNEMREREISFARNNIEYLTKQLVNIDSIEMKNVFYQLIEEQTQKLMLAEVRTEFVFSIIDPPVVPELKHAPRRSLICILVLFITGFITTSFYIVRFLLATQQKQA